MSSTKPEVHNVSQRCRRRTEPQPQATGTKKFGKDRACGSRDIVADRQTNTHKHTQMYSSQYVATAPEDEMIKNN